MIKKIKILIIKWYKILIKRKIIIKRQMWLKKILLIKKKHMKNDFEKKKKN